MQSCIDCICKIFLQSVFLDVSLNDLPEQMLRSFSRWSFQMLPQGPLLSRCIAILVTFPKIARKIVLLAIVGLPCLFPFHIIADRFQRRCVHPDDQYATVQTDKVWLSQFQLLLSMSNLVVTLLTTDIFIFGGNMTHKEKVKFLLNINIIMTT